MPIFSADYASDPAVRRRVMSALWALMTPAVAYLYVQVDRVYRGGGGGGGGGGGRGGGGGGGRQDRARPSTIPSGTGWKREDLEELVRRVLTRLGDRDFIAVASRKSACQKTSTLTTHILVVRPFPSLSLDCLALERLAARNVVTARRALSSFSVVIGLLSCPHWLAKKKDLYE